MSARAALLDHVARHIAALEPDRAVVAVDGVDGAGKTMFADELATAVRSLGRQLVRAGVDGFHNPREIRYSLGHDSPEGFFLDSYDYDAMNRVLLMPFRVGASTVRTACFDHRSNREVSVVSDDIDKRSVLLIDGIFLHRDELAANWDLSVFLDVPFTVSYARMATRDGSDPDPAALQNRRYLEGQEIYLRACNPRSRATFIIDNADLAAPRLLRQTS